MPRKVTADELIRNAVWSVESAAHRVKLADTPSEVRKRASFLRRKVDELERRALAAAAEPR